MSEIRFCGPRGMRSRPWVLALCAMALLAGRSAVAEGQPTEGPPTEEPPTEAPIDEAPIVEEPAAEPPSDDPPILEERAAEPPSDEAAPEADDATAEPAIDDDALADLYSVEAAVPALPPLASAQRIPGATLRLRPYLGTSDALNAVPGLLAVQHAGGGKAQQWFLRGFDADHGTDVAFFVDDVPINLSSHGHGQGYTELHFLPPELLEEVRVRRGTSYADLGDFATAGAIELRLVDRLPRSSVTVAGGRFATFRVLGLFGAESERVSTVFAAEAMGTDGPFENAEELRRMNLVGRVRVAIPHGAIRLTATSYASGWDASGQIPLRAVRAGQLDRFGALDPFEGGSGQRHSLVLGLERALPEGRGDLRLTAYLVHYRFALYSNFTFFSEDPVAGDMIRQGDVRTYGGLRVAHAIDRRWGDLALAFRSGADARYDASDTTLDRAPGRVATESIVDASVGESRLGLYGEAELRYGRLLAATVGLRADHGLFTARDLRDVPPDEAGSGERQAMIVSPKARLAIHPHETLSLMVGAGSGFHSNDARGVVLRVDAADPFARAITYEAGARFALDDRLVVSATGYLLDLESEIVWVGDAGTTEPSGRTRRIGAELVAEAKRDWLGVDLAYQWSRARFRDAPAGEDRVPLAPVHLLTAGVSGLHPIGLRGRLGLTYLGDRPATEDGFLVAEGWYRLDLAAEYTHERFGLGLSMQNLTGARYRTAQFATVTRLSGEDDASACPAGTRASGNGADFAGCEDVSFTPGWPFTVIGSASVSF